MCANKIIHVGDTNGTSHACNECIATIRVLCIDTTGVVAAIAQLLQGCGVNILRSDQHTDKDSNTPYYFQRLVVDYKDILEKYGGLDCDIVLIISNHDKLESVAGMFGIPFRHLPISPGDKRGQELEIEALLEEHHIDLVVLAKYMQILSNEFCTKHSAKIINIHHSPLPAFEGARPYHRAHERGVKLIGATAHYATAELDAGPIIEQDISRISHRDHIKDLIRKGRDLERVVLARAVRWHCLDAILVHNSKAIVFDT